MNKKVYSDRVKVKKRMFVILLGLTFLFTVLIGRLAYLMIYKGKEYKKLAINQWTSEVKISAKRGRILDRNKNELAISANVYRVDLDLNALRQTMESKKLTVEQVAASLSEVLEMSLDEVVKIINKKFPSGLPYGSATLKRRIEKPMADKIRELDIRGVLVSADTKRYYPNNNFLTHVLGHTNSDGEGLTGIEMYYNTILSGEPGKRIAEMDSTRTSELPYVISEFTEPEDGKDVVLTIDEMIQHFVEKAADQALKDNKAKAVTIIVSNPNNGEILAMVNKPDYDPNSPWIEGKSGDDLQAAWRNRAVNDTFEPGSIFKVFTMAAALDEKISPEGEIFNCNGSTTIGSNTIKCWNWYNGGHGSQSLIDILKNSCNVGFAELGRRLGKDRLASYISKYGFGQSTGIDLPGEAKGIVKKAASMAEIDLATISFGQANTVSTVQYIAAFNAAINGGKWIRPHLLKEVLRYDEATNKYVVDKEFDNYGEKQIISEETSKTLRAYLEKVVTEGGSKNAFIEGYRIGGKTGTAQKPIGGRYVSGKYISSFAGMAPADNPLISLFVSIDEPDPSNYYGGQIAAPVGQQIFNDIFNYLSLKSDATLEEVAESLKKNIIIPEVRGMKKADGLKVLKEAGLDYKIDTEGEYIVDINPKPGYTVKEGSKILLYTGAADNYNKVVVVPSLTGYGLERASQIINNLGLKLEYNGYGLVYYQSIAEGKEVTKGTTIHLKLEEVIE